MTLAPGTRLGPYEIVAAIGAGGMGEVYEAHDPRLDRQVAIKILPPQLSDDFERRARFEREARTIAALNHPHICTLYDVGDAQGQTYLVMEHLKGETAAARLRRGPLPLEQVLAIGRQVSGALAAAHRQGVIHRDLKPSNVMLTKAGAKLLDFGLATPVESGRVRTLVAQDVASTHEEHLTAPRELLGTLPYMAPEQLEGRPADARSDVWALGCLIYELGTGHPAFVGASQASLIAQIMNADPPTLLIGQSPMPTALDRIVRTCLAKDPDDRWQSAADLEHELEWLAKDRHLAEGSHGGIGEGTPRQDRKTTERGGVRRASGLAAAVLLAGVVLVWARFGTEWFAGTGSARRDTVAVQLSFTPPTGTTRILAPAVSPDGLHVAFAAAAPGEPHRLWIRTLGEAAARVVEGTEGASLPFWSPDGSNVAFWDSRSAVLKRLSLSGGAPREIAKAPEFSGGSWARDGTILLAPFFLGGLYRTSVKGGQLEPVTRLDAGRREVSHRHPQFLPDGRRFLVFVRTEKPGEDGLFWGALDSPALRPVLRSTTSAAFVEPDYLLAVRQGVLEVRRLRMEDLTFLGDPEPLPTQVRIAAELDTQRSPISVTRDLLVYSPLHAPVTHLTEYDRHGKPLRSFDGSGYDDGPAIEPSGRRLIVRRTDPLSGISNLWLYEGSTATPLLQRPFVVTRAVWLDERRVLFGERAGFWRIRLLDLDHVDHVDTVGAVPLHRIVEAVSPDRRHVVFAEGGRTGWSLKIMQIDGTGEVESLGTYTRPAFSPDGTTVAYVSDVAGDLRVSVASFPASNRVRVVSGPGVLDEFPCWRSDGRELFFLYADGRVSSVSVPSASLRTVGEPRTLFHVALAPPRLEDDDFACWGPPDGPRLIVRETVGPVLPEEWLVVVNWRKLLGG